MVTKTRWLIAALLIISGPLYADERCPLKGSEDVAATHPECLFYSGTSSFRDKDYARAAAFWKRLIGLKAVPVEFEHLRTSAYNNLGYLYFFGHGVQTNKKAALDYWHYAAKSGSEEAPYHLCHAYAEPDEPTYNPKLAIGHCTEALRRYDLLKERDEGIDTIVRQLKNYIRVLNAPAKPGI